MHKMHETKPALYVFVDHSTVSIISDAIGLQLPIDRSLKLMNTRKCLYRIAALSPHFDTQSCVSFRDREAVETIISDPVCVTVRLVTESVLEILPIFMKRLVIVGFPMNQNVWSACLH